eukprot:TRINITY_DN15871_c0_g1_i2.p1 TRINITY_DN15871_c0_g1~~TRINITY_DN15871_c0_g1_i2.p1  ORF type:complete len:529 (+),score=104.55 TRINITY_DN15871_c0_g1_i2:74-1660(+)
MIKRPKLDSSDAAAVDDDDDDIMVISSPGSDVEDIDESTLTTTPVTCNICKKQMETGEHNMTTLPCGHYFGKSCITQQLGDQRSSICIVCREVFQQKDIRSIFVTSEAIEPSQRQKRLATTIIRNERRKEQIHQKKMQSSQVKVEANIAVDTLLSDHKRIKDLRSRLLLPSYRVDELDEDCDSPNFRRTAVISLSDDYPSVISSNGFIFLFGNINKSVLLSKSTLSVIKEIPGCVTNAVLEATPGSELVAVFENTTIRIFDLSDGCNEKSELIRYKAISSCDDEPASLPQPAITSMSRGGNVLYCGLENGDVIKYDLKDTSAAPLLFRKTINAEVGLIVVLQQHPEEVLMCAAGSSSFIVTNSSLYPALPTLSSALRVAAATTCCIALLVNSGSNCLQQVCLYSFDSTQSMLIATIPIYQQQSQSSSSFSTPNTTPSYPTDDIFEISTTPVRCALLSNLQNSKSDDITWAASDGDDVFIGSTTNPSEVQCLSRRRQPVLDLFWDPGTASELPSLFVLTASQLSVFSAS